MMQEDRDMPARRRSIGGTGKSLAMAALLSAMLLPLSGCLTPKNPYALSPTEVDATRAGLDLAFEALTRTGGDGGGGGGD